MALDGIRTGTSETTDLPFGSSQSKAKSTKRCILRHWLTAMAMVTIMFGSKNTWPCEYYKSRVILFEATMVAFSNILATHPFWCWFSGSSSLPHSNIQGDAWHRSCHNMQLSKPSNLWMPNKCSQGESIFGNIAYPTCLRLADGVPFSAMAASKTLWPQPCKTMNICTHKAPMESTSIWVSKSHTESDSNLLNMGQRSRLSYVLTVPLPRADTMKQSISFSGSTGLPEWIELIIELRISSKS